MVVNLEEILKNLVKIPTENPPGLTDEIIDYLISEVFKESAGFRNEIMSYNKKGIDLKNIVAEGFNIFTVPFNAYGNTGRRVGNFSLNPMAFSQLVYERSKANALNDPAYFQSFCDVVPLHFVPDTQHLLPRMLYRLFESIDQRRGFPQ